MRNYNPLKFFPENLWWIYKEPKLFLLQRYYRKDWDLKPSSSEVNCVHIFSTGTMPLGLARGQLKFRLFGELLRLVGGEF
jgi:hypothetical protein